MNHYGLPHRRACGGGGRALPDAGPRLLLLLRFPELDPEAAQRSLRDASQRRSRGSAGGRGPPRAKAVRRPRTPSTVCTASLRPAGPRTTTSRRFGGDEPRRSREKGSGTPQGADARARGDPRALERCWMVFLRDPGHGSASREWLREAYDAGGIIICDVVYAELAPAFPDRRALDRGRSAKSMSSCPRSKRTTRTWLTTPGAAGTAIDTGKPAVPESESLRTSSSARMRWRRPSTLPDAGPRLLFLLFPRTRQILSVPGGHPRRAIQPP